MMYTVSLSVDVEGIECHNPVQATELAIQALEVGVGKFFTTLVTGHIAHVLPEKGAAVTVRLGRKAFTIIEGDD